MNTLSGGSSVRSNAVAEGEEIGAGGIVLVEELRAAAGRADVAILDARPLVFFRAGHIPGAISLPWDRFVAEFPALRERLTEGGLAGIVIYCSGGDCEDSARLTRLLAAEGIGPLAIIRRGVGAMERDGTRGNFAVTRQRLFQFARLALSVVSVAAGIVKLHDPQVFATSVATFRVLPREWSNAIAIALPAFEILCGGLLFAAGWQRAAALGIALLNGVFVGLLLQGMMRGLNMDCGCFGKWDPGAGHPWMAIVRDLVFLLLAMGCCRGARPAANLCSTAASKWSLP